MMPRFNSHLSFRDKKHFSNFSNLLSLRDRKFRISNSTQISKDVKMWMGLQLHPPKNDDRYAQLTRGAFTINDFLRNSHFMIL